MRLKSILNLLLLVLILFAGNLLAEPYPSTYSPLPSEDTLIIHATILTGTGERLDEVLR